MWPEIGLVLLISAWLFSFLLAIMPIYGVVSGNVRYQCTANALTWAVFIGLTLAFSLLIHAFVVDDFSVSIVNLNSNSALPWYYKFAATWGNHEGSMLLWVQMLSLWSVAVTLFTKTLTRELKSALLGVLGLVLFLFLSFVLFTSNPFERSLPFPPSDGSDLNPLLQDIGLIMHPPMLYMGYVGFSVAFAFALAALITGRFDVAWTRWARPWTNVAWSFLTLGIALGSWWAYYELGWGGWWFWDPVENASFMPWLIGTALIHAQAVTEKRNLFKSWSLLLAILAFSFSLLGTFLVRSGVIQSVHAFVNDPERGLFILGILMITIAGSLALYSWRASQIKAISGFSPVSREGFILINNILLVVLTIAILLGTLYPLIADIFGWRKLSVGAPFFNFVFNIVMVLILSGLGIGQLLNWKRHRQMPNIALVGLVIAAIVVIALVLPLALVGVFHWQIWLGMALVFWVLASLVRLLWQQGRHRASMWAGLRRASWGFWGMWLAHLGVLVSTTGVVLVSNLDHEKEFLLSPGKVVELGGYEFKLVQVEQIQGPNYLAEQGQVEVSKAEKPIALLQPEKRQYQVQRSVMTEAGIDGNLWRDLYATLGNQINEEANSWAVAIKIKPFVRWIWWGAVFMALGAILALCDKRYRMKFRSETGEV